MVVEMSQGGSRKLTTAYKYKWKIKISEILFSPCENANENAFLVLSIQTIYVGMKLKKLIIN